MKKMFLLSSLLIFACTLCGYDLKTRDGKKIYRDYKGLGGPSLDGRGLVIYYEDYRKAIVLPHNFPNDFPDKAALKKQLARLPAAKKEALANRKARLAEEKAENAERKKQAERIKKRLSQKPLVAPKMPSAPKASSTKKKFKTNK